MPLHGGDVYRFISCGGITLDFSVNTNPLGIPDRVAAALTKHFPEFALYPDPYCRTIRRTLAAYEGVRESAILCGAGASDLIYRLCLACRPRRVLLCAPTFSEYAHAAQLAGAEVVSYRLSEPHTFRLTSHFLETITRAPIRGRAQGVDMIFLCNPNNPTGMLIDPILLAEIVAACETLPILLVVDECFLPFTHGDSLVLSKGSGMPRHLVVLKAFTKTFALAGLRFGYLITTNEALLTQTAKAGPCWNVSVPAQVAALAVLGCTEHVENANRLIAVERPFLSQGLRALGFTVFASDANFLLFKSERDMPLGDALAGKGILIRPCDNFHGLDKRYYRICIKTRDANETLLAAIKEVVLGEKELP
jgi:threonine-phosphate decarboxylase